MPYTASACKEIFRDEEKGKGKQMTTITTTSDVQVKPLLHRREIAALRLGVSLRLLDELLATRQLASVKIGKRRLISESAIIDFIRRAEKK
jgi:excisionase family DNA binding protein